jgi:hypothetical protein
VLFGEACSVLLSVASGFVSGELPVSPLVLSLSLFFSLSVFLCFFSIYRDMLKRNESSFLQKLVVA